MFTSNLSTCSDLKVIERSEYKFHTHTHKTSNQNTPNSKYSCSGWSVFECEYKYLTRKFYEHKMGL
jgi:hypothetical protein